MIIASRVRDCMGRLWVRPRIVSNGGGRYTRAAPTERNRVRFAAAVVVVMLLGRLALAQEEEGVLSGYVSAWNPKTLKLLKGEFAWTVGDALTAGGQPMEDPAVVHHAGRWHLFCTARGEDGRPAIEHLSFADWKEAGAARRQAVRLGQGGWSSAQVFHFEPRGRWYLVCQSHDRPARPVYSTNEDAGDAAGWSEPRPLLAGVAEVPLWGGFRVICDEDTAYVFFSSGDGRIWRTAMPLGRFPGGKWLEPVVVLKGDFAGGARVYALKGLRRYLMLVEAREEGRRYLKAYIAPSLAGTWNPLADTPEKPFAGPANVRLAGGATPWTDSIGRGELLRLGTNQRMEVDPHNLRMLFQGASSTDRAEKGYGRVPWRLGMIGVSAE